MISGLVGALQTMRKRSGQAFAPSGAGQRSAAQASKAAFPIAAEGIGKLLEAVNAASSIIRVLSDTFEAITCPTH